MRTLVYVFLFVYLLNVVPAFAPPTWMVFSFLGFRHPGINIFFLAVDGALAASLGRVTLAKLSNLVIRQRFMGQSARENVDAIRIRMEQRRKLTFSVFLLYAFSPFPSNYLFIAYGLTAMDLVVVAVPFFIGRAISYSFWGVTSSAVASHVSRAVPVSYLSAYFIITQIALLFAVYLFTRLDWAALFDERKLRMLPRHSAQDGPKD